LSPGLIDTPIYNKLGMAKKQQGCPGFHPADPGTEISESCGDRKGDSFFSGIK